MNTHYIRKVRLWIGLFCSLGLGIVLSSCSTVNQGAEGLGSVLKSGRGLGRFEENHDAKKVDTTARLNINGLKGFFFKGYAEKQTGIYIMEPFDPKKVPVLFIHGLLSEPRTWRGMVEELQTDPDITKNYQFWFYAYPTATPVVPSAAVLKRHLDGAIRTVEKEYGVSMNRRLIVIGHSMGGMLAKSLVSKTGDRLWDAVFTAPLEEFDLTELQKKQLGAAFRYEPRRYVDEVIFIASPQRGSHLADSFGGRIGSKFSARPKSIEELSEALITKNRDRLKPEFYKFVADNVNAISTLRPDSPVTALLADLPVDKGVTFHTLAGIKQKDYKEGQAEAGDGIVPLESTVVPGARCEVGIYSGHSVHATKDAQQIVHMLLRLHAGLAKEPEVRAAIRTMPLPFARYNP